MTSELLQDLCDIIETQNRMIRQLIDLLAQHQTVAEYEREMERQEREYAAVVSGQEGR